MIDKISDSQFIKKIIILFMACTQKRSIKNIQRLSLVLIRVLTITIIIFVMVINNNYFTVVASSYLL